MHSIMYIQYNTLKFRLSIGHFPINWKKLPNLLYLINYGWKGLVWTWVSYTVFYLYYCTLTSELVKNQFSKAYSIV